MGLTAVLLARTREAKLIILAVAVLVCFFLAMTLMTVEKNHRREEQAVIDQLCEKAEKEKEAAQQKAEQLPEEKKEQ